MTLCILCRFSVSLKNDSYFPPPVLYEFPVSLFSIRGVVGLHLGVWLYQNDLALLVVDFP